MITDIVIPTSEQLKELVEEALQNTTKEELIATHADGIAEVLRNSPLSYRNYGPYWWAIKALLREQGFDFGEEDEPVTREHFNYADKVELVCAAWAYTDYQVDSGYLFQGVHEFQTDDEPLEYSIEDPDLEALDVNGLNK